jgi:hypothetical protein
MSLAQLNERLPIVATIDPQTLDNTAADSDWIDLSLHRRVMFIVLLGATDTTVNVKLRSASASDGTGAADISGKAITQLGATDDNKQVIIEIDAAELAAVGASARYVGARVTVGDGAAGAIVAVVAITESRYSPAGSYDLSTVAEIVA